MMDGWIGAGQNTWAHVSAQGPLGQHCHPPGSLGPPTRIEIQENEVKTGGLGRLGRCDRYSPCSHSSSSGNSLNPTTGNSVSPQSPEVVAEQS